MKKAFEIEVRCISTLEIDELWPDGDAPENPTTRDVEILIEQYGGILTVLRDWGLWEDLDFEVIDLGD